MLEIYRWWGGIARKRRRDVLLHEPVGQLVQEGGGMVGYVKKMN